MANISTYLQKILAAVYGEEVRSSIHDALAAMNVESSNAMQFASTAKDSAQASAAEAKTSASTATQKATAASVSAQAAKTSENNAKVSESNASNKAKEATDAADAAKASEIAAGSSAAIASQKAGEAATSQAAAALSEAEAKAAEERIKTIKSDAETLGAQIAADRTAAEKARDDAQTAADDAALAETNAKLSENAALGAQTAAEFAKDDAEVAKLAAQDAQVAAETAKDAAELSEDAADKSAKDAAASALSAQQYSGKPPKPQDGTWWIWDASQQKYVDSGIGCDLVGPTGNGIQDIKLTKGDHTPGTTDIYTVTMTDGTSYPVSVYNGRNGTGAGDVLGIWFDLVLPADGWKDGEITIADSRLLALATHKYFISADEASRDEFLDCKVQPKDITTTGFITFKSETDPAEDLTVNVIRFELSANGA
ncbi:hypothetical protein [Oscillibacter sp. CU971]|uniref:hypothetical protein n=1 Tax=Oscillibacter sp. CU971 TaxID=2780102 RepID=UPI00195C2AC2|nr:hypothetical protein [Oscillibacter sp. CU971]